MNQIDHISVSGLRTFYQCGLKYQFQNQDDVLPGLQHGPQIRGQALDKAANEHFRTKAHNGIGISITDFIDLALEEIEVNRDTTDWQVRSPNTPIRRGEFIIKSEKDVIDLVKAQAMKYWSVYGKMFTPRSENDVQITITKQFEGMTIPITGIIDLITKEGVIVDTKLTKNVPRLGDAARNWQLRTYCLLTGLRQGALAVIDDLSLIPDFHTIEVDFDQVSINAMLDKFIKFNQSLTNDVFLPALEDSWYCSERWCRFFDSCIHGAGEL